MGMVLTLTTLSDANIERVLADPPLIWKVVAADEPELYEQSRRDASKSSFLGSLFGKKRVAAAPPVDLTLGASEGISTDLDKAWHGIHYLLTGTADEGESPSSFLVSGGRTVGDIEVGYCPARAFTAAETKAIHSTIAALSEDLLRSRFDPQAMTALEIYPDIWNRGRPDDDTIGYVVEYFRLLRGFLEQTTGANVGMVVTLT